MLSGSLKQDYRIVRIAKCLVNERDIWLEWRDDRKTIPTSTIITSYFGYGFRSWDKTTRERLEVTKKSTEEQTKKIKDNYSYATCFSQTAKEHGTRLEPKAKEAILKCISTSELYFDILQVENGDESSHVVIKKEEKSTEVITTPDMILEYCSIEDKGLMIVEIKCPYHCILKRGNDSIYTTVCKFYQKNLYGKENAFIQAGVYSMVFGARLFRVVFYFTDTVDEEFILVYTYKPTEELYEQLFKAIENTKDALERMDRGEKGKPLRIPQNEKNKLKENMEICNINNPYSTFIYDVKNDTIEWKLQMNSPPTMANNAGNAYQGNQVVIGADALDVSANSLATNLSPPLDETLV